MKAAIMHFGVWVGYVYPVSTVKGFTIFPNNLAFSGQGAKTRFQYIFKLYQEYDFLSVDVGYVFPTYTLSELKNFFISTLEGGSKC